MGGDRAPGVVVEGLQIAAERHPRARFLLVGDEAQLAPLLQRYRRAAGACTVRHTATVISNDMKPAAALRAPASCWSVTRPSSPRCCSAIAAPPVPAPCATPPR